MWVDYFELGLITYLFLVKLKDSVSYFDSNQSIYNSLDLRCPRLIQMANLPRALIVCAKVRSDGIILPIILDLLLVLLDMWLVLPPHFDR